MKIDRREKRKVSRGTRERRKVCPSVQPAGLEENEENRSGLLVKKMVAGNSSGSPETKVGLCAGN